MAKSDETKADDTSRGSVTDAISRLATSGGAMTLSGTVFEEARDAITILIGSSLFDIPREFILASRDIASGSGGKVVELTVANNAQLIQRMVSSPLQALVAANPLLVAGACDCACNCNCACDCACGSGSFAPMFVPGLEQRIFRTQMFRRF